MSRIAWHSVSHGHISLTTDSQSASSDGSLLRNDYSPGTVLSNVKSDTGSGVVWTAEMGDTEPGGVSDAAEVHADFANASG